MKCARHQSQSPIPVTKFKLKTNIISVQSNRIELKHNLNDGTIDSIRLEILLT